MLGALVVGFCTQSDVALGKRVGVAFGNTCASIGILVGLAAVVGQCMLESGAAERIVRSALRAVGERMAPAAFSAAGFLLGIPVFFDTVFLLMLPLGKAAAARTGKDYGLYVMTIAGGASIAHSLVPPTPGPLFVAGALNVDVGTMIVAGTLVGGLSTVVGFAYVWVVNRRWPVPLRDAEALAAPQDRPLPGLLVSLLPIALPVLLIGGGAAAGGKAAWADPIVAMAIGTAVSMATFPSRLGLAACVQKGLLGAGPIILVTASGGAFGGMLQQTGIGDRIAAMAAGHREAILPLAFAVTALIRTTQGSATVAMTTSAGIFAGMAAPEALGFHPVYLALAIGFGSKPFSWMNDSGFWMVTRLAGLTPRETLRCFSTQTTLMGVTGILLCMLFARMAPLL